MIDWPKKDVHIATDDVKILRTVHPRSVGILHVSDQVPSLWTVSCLAWSSRLHFPLMQGRSQARMRSEESDWKKSGKRESSTTRNGDLRDILDERRAKRKGQQSLTLVSGGEAVLVTCISECFWPC